MLHILDNESLQTTFVGSKNGTMNKIGYISIQTKWVAARILAGKGANKKLLPEHVSTLLLVEVGASYCMNSCMLWVGFCIDYIEILIAFVIRAMSVIR